MIPTLCNHSVPLIFSPNQQESSVVVMPVGLHMCPDQLPTHQQAIAHGSTAVLLPKMQTHGLKDGTKKEQRTACCFLDRCINVTHITWPRNCCKISLPHWAAPSHSFPPQFHGSSPLTWPHCSLHRQNDAAWKSPLSVGEGARTTDTTFATVPKAATLKISVSCVLSSP